MATEAKINLEKEIFGDSDDQLSDNEQIEFSSDEESKKMTKISPQRA